MEIKTKESFDELEIDMKRPDILDFIHNFKRDFNEEELITVFTEGNCYHFAVILQNLYSEGEIVYSDSIGHFMFQMGDKLYDITGEASADKVVSFNHLMMTEPHLYDVIMRDCVYRE